MSFLITVRYCSYPCSYKSDFIWLTTSLMTSVSLSVCCIDSKGFGLEIKSRHMLKQEGQTETLVWRSSVMERLPDRPVQFYGKASEAALQTCSAWLDVLKSLCCSYVVWQIAFFFTVQLIFLSLYLIFILDPLELNIELESIHSFCKFGNCCVDECS